MNDSEQDDICKTSAFANSNAALNNASMEAGTYIKKPLTPMPKIWVGYILATVSFALKSLVFYYMAMPMILLDKVTKEAMLDVTRTSTYIITYIGIMACSVYWLYCIYKIHVVLAESTGNEYSITPGRAVVGHLFPFYDIYCLFKWSNEIRLFVNNKMNSKIIYKHVPGLLILYGFIWVWAADGLIGFVVVYATSSYIVRGIKHALP
jgi:hypothetical protein